MTIGQTLKRRALLGLFALGSLAVSAQKKGVREDVPIRDSAKATQPYWNITAHIYDSASKTIELTYEPDSALRNGQNAQMLRVYRDGKKRKTRQQFSGDDKLIYSEIFMSDHAQTMRMIANYETKAKDSLPYTVAEYIDENKPDSNFTLVDGDLFLPEEFKDPVIRGRQTAYEDALLRTAGKTGDTRKAIAIFRHDYRMVATKLDGKRKRDLLARQQAEEKAIQDSIDAHTPHLSVRYNRLKKNWLLDTAIINRDGTYTVLYSNDRANAKTAPQVHYRETHQYKPYKLEPGDKLLSQGFTAKLPGSKKADTLYVISMTYDTTGKKDAVYERAVWLMDSNKKMTLLDQEATQFINPTKAHMLMDNLREEWFNNNPRDPWSPEADNTRRMLNKAGWKHGS